MRRALLLGVRHPVLVAEGEGDTLRVREEQGVAEGLGVAVRRPLGEGVTLRERVVQAEEEGQDDALRLKEPVGEAEEERQLVTVTVPHAEA